MEGYGSFGCFVVFCVCFLFVIGIVGGVSRFNLYSFGICVRRVFVRCVSNGVRRVLVGIILLLLFFMNEKLVFIKKIRYKSVIILLFKCNDS